MKKNLFLLCTLILSYYSYGQNVIPSWSINGSHIVNDEMRKIKPDQYIVANIDNNVLKSFLFALENSRNAALIIQIPNPHGHLESFYIWESSIMDTELQNKYSDIRTYSGIKTDDPNTTAKFDYTEYGFHGMVFGKEGTYYIDPLYYEKGDEYQVYFKSGFDPSKKSIHPCLVSGQDHETSSRMTEINPDYGSSVTPLRNHGNVRKEYRLALSCTGEYAIAVTGSPTPTKAAVLSAMVTTMNRVNGIYEKELSVRMILIANNDDIIYTNPSTDPYTANNNGFLLLSQNQTNVSSVIGLSNFDIGHIFSTGGGGVASLASLCFNSQKARGVTGSDEPFGDPYDVDYVSHEMGHQFGANHTFNNCSGNENTETAFEPGSGSTIMAYAGICGISNNLQNNSHDYFHNASLNEISRYISGETHGGTGTCGISTSGSPIITLPSYAGIYNIPMNTAFEVLAPDAAWDHTSDLTYSWEQHDLGQLGRNESAGNTATSAPVFRSYKHSVEGQYRSFPHADSVHRNVYSFRGERMPSVSRSIKTKVTVRGTDSEGFGAFYISNDIITVNIVEGAEALIVTSPNTGTESYLTGSSVTVTWDPGGSTAAPISSESVDILLSIDGGRTYPYILATDVGNSGSAGIVIPSGSETTKARIKIKGHNNIFYDVSNNNFVITAGTSNMVESEKIDFKIYPNPVTDILHIEYDKMHEVHSIIIINVLGQEVYHSYKNITSQISTAHLPPGYYTIKLQDLSSNVSGLKSFIKQ